LHQAIAMEGLVKNVDDLLQLLDDVVERPLNAAFWERFFADRNRPCPFFHHKPGEHLVGYFQHGRLRAGRALDLGCGNGRDAVFMASRGCVVDAVDLAQEALNWGSELADNAGVEVNFIKRSIFALEFEPQSYDIVHDSGCFHHLTPHRRISYLSLLARALKPAGHVVLSCLGPEIAASPSDREIYEGRKAGGERGFSLDELRAIFEPHYELLELRAMTEQPNDAPAFGRGFIQVALMRRPA
jgi:2-polyprenyl-3-methyl-5-hydroxy-6-metoxy-1,4-benzoquinol methylase